MATHLSPRERGTAGPAFQRMPNGRPSIINSLFILHVSITNQWLCTYSSYEIRVFRYFPCGYLYTLFFSDVVVSHSTTPQPTSAPSGRSTSTELAISDYVRIPQTKLEFSVISPPDFSRQAYVMLLLLSFFFFFLTISWSKEISETTRSIFIKF